MKGAFMKKFFNILVVFVGIVFCSENCLFSMEVGKRTPRRQRSRSYNRLVAEMRTSNTFRSRALTLDMSPWRFLAAANEVYFFDTTKEEIEKLYKNMSDLSYQQYSFLMSIVVNGVKLDANGEMKNKDGKVMAKLDEKTKNDFIEKGFLNSDFTGTSLFVYLNSVVCPFFSEIYKNKNKLDKVKLIPLKEVMDAENKVLRRPSFTKEY